MNETDQHADSSTINNRVSLKIYSSLIFLLKFEMPRKFVSQRGSKRRIRKNQESCVVVTHLVRKRVTFV